jgi:RNA methyltransferase, TrmH family
MKKTNKKIDRPAKLVSTEMEKKVNERANEVRIYGWNASLATFKRRPEDLVRVYTEKRRVKELGHLLKYCAQKKIAYHVVERDDLIKITKSSHHEGLAVIAKARATLQLKDLVQAYASDTVAQPIVMLEGVENPHNIGAIMRTCAHFGVTWILYLGQSPFSFSPSMIRIAEGGYEFTNFVDVSQDPKAAFKFLKSQRFKLIATEVSNQSESIYRKDWSPRSIIIFGNEGKGIKTDVKALCDESVHIPGSGFIESLNVSVAVGALLSAYSARNKNV